MIQYLSDSFPKLQELVWPTRGAGAELASLKFQASRFNPTPEPSEDDFNRVLSRILFAYPETQTPNGFEGGKLKVSDETILFHLSQVNPKSSPGVPFMHMERTKGVLLNNYSAMVVSAVKERLRILNSVDLRRQTAVELVMEGFCDPVRLFVKNEPHSKEKAETSRWRLISSLSIIDEVVERILCSVQNGTEILNWSTVPSKVGFGVSDDAQTEIFWNELKKHMFDMYETDISGWDWCVQGWMLDWECRFRIALCRAQENAAYKRILSNRFYCLSLSVFVLSNGDLYAQTLRGLMKSGSYVTSSSNSRIRVACAYLINSPWAVGYGDDALEGKSPDAKEKYEGLGLKVKFYKKCENDYEFCSHRFQIVNGQPLSISTNFEKGLFRLASTPYDEETYQQFVYQYRHSPQLPLALSLLSEYGWNSQNSGNNGKQKGEQQE